MTHDAITTDQALVLFRRLHHEYTGIRYSRGQERRTARLGALKYRAFTRWQRRNAIAPGTMTPDYYRPLDHASRISPRH